MERVRVNNEQLDRIEKMLRAQLKSAGHIWWVSGWVYGQTSNSDLFIILYPAAENLKEKVVRVYDHDMKRLPSFIPINVDGGDTEANPSKEQARKKGVYHECPAFEIVTYDGKDTQMGKERRFGDVLRLSRAASEAAAQGVRSAPTSTQPAQPSSSPALPPLAAPGTSPTELPDYRALALGAKTMTEFDYAAFMAVKGGLYIDQERIRAMREALVPGWHPGEKTNSAMLVALEVYQRTRLAVENESGDRTKAHNVGKREALRAYNRVIEGRSESSI